MLDIWPELPIVIISNGNPGGDNIIDALKLNDRVSLINFWWVSSSALETVMQGPFPALEYCAIESFDEMLPVISDSFLGGSTPRLRYLSLHGIPFPALPKLLLSATDLVTLYLSGIPHSGYISPGAMVTCLSALTRLEGLSLEFRSPRSRPDRARRLRPPLTRTILPALTSLSFRGVTEYLEDLIARIDAPLLGCIKITFFNQLVFDILQLPKLLCRTEKFTALGQADVSFGSDAISVELSQNPRAVDPTTPRVTVEISCSQLDWQLSSLVQVCNQALPTLSTLERLDLGSKPDDVNLLPGQVDVENVQWLELLYPFTNVKNLHISKNVAPCVAPALQELTGEGVTEVLPALQNIFLDGFQLSPPVQEAIRQFVAARQFSGHPVAIHHEGGGWGMSSLLLSKPFRCPKPNCNKSYKQASGLKYHTTHGSCNFAPPKDLEALQALLAEKGVVVNGNDRSGVQITEGELREVEREAERRLRPFACGVGDCQRRYKNMSGLRTSPFHPEVASPFGLISC